MSITQTKINYAITTKYYVINAIFCSNVLLTFLEIIIMTETPAYCMH